MNIGPSCEYHETLRHQRAAARRSGLSVNSRGERGVALSLKLGNSPTFYIGYRIRYG